MTNPVNSEAGDVPYPSDPAEIALAEYAARLIWRACPYFEHRYGGRGRRFGSSDAGYLVVIATESQAVFFDQVDWLARVLAERGMPSCLLELQLRILARCGSRWNWSGTATAQAGAERLLSIRRQRLSESQQQGIQSICERASIFPARSWNAGLGLLVASAIADESAGIASSTGPLFGWLLEQELPRGSMAAVLDDVAAFLDQQ